MNPFKKIRYRVTLYLAFALSLIGLLFSTFFTTTFFQFTQMEFEKKIYEDAKNLASELESRFEKGVLPNIPGIDKSRIYLLKDEKNNEVLKSLFLQENKIEIETEDKQLKLDHYFTDLNVKDEHFRVVTIKLKNNHILHYGISSNLIRAQKEKIFYLNLAGFPILIFLIAGVSYLLISRSLLPMKIMNETMNSIVSKNLSKRIPSIKMSHEFETLSQSINDLLERLEKSFDAQEHFVANASHQLYTPLAIMKGELEVLQSKERTQEEHNKFHHSLRQELERMVDLVKNLLLISRIEAGHEESFKMRPMRLDDMMISTTSRMKLKAKEKNISVKLDFDEDIDIEELIINGERQLLSSLFENLIDNSIKYSPDNSTINVKIKKDKDIIISVQDQGPGIKNNELKSILEKRFQRGTMTLMPGTGIGLSIAYKIAAHHKAKIEYQKLEPAGSLFSVHFSI